MATTIVIRSSAAAAALLAVALLAGTARPAPTAATCGGGRTLFAADGPTRLTEAVSHLHVTPLRPAYGWPVMPFDRQHPVRANLDDPRIGGEGGTSFHFGIDIAVPDRTPVYAVAGGEAYVAAGHISVAESATHVFGYWHVRAAVANRQRVREHQLLGWVIPGWEHVHFAERVRGVYLNPLRPGGLGPYRDTSTPTIAEIAVVRSAAGVELLTDAYDTPSLPVPGSWANEPVSPALLQWRIVAPGRTSTWHTAADFRTRMLDRGRFSSVYAPATRQNHKGDAGRYCFFLDHDWKPAEGRYGLEVAASDTRGNRAVARIEVTVAEGQVAS